GRGTTVADASGNGISGELVGEVCWPEGRVDEGLHFDGLDGYVDLGNPEALRIEGSLTISAWIKPLQFPWDDATIVSKRNGVEWGYQLDVTRDSGERTIGFKLTTASGESMFRYGSTPIEADRWYHVTGVYDASARELHVYLDGERDDGEIVGRVDSEQLNSEKHVTIGQRTGTSEYAFNGYIDDVRLYDRALSEPEVRADVEVPVMPERSSPREVSEVW
ncbi:MAG: LamG domain-containing protein, partial [Polyangiales bacterium]